MIAYSKLIDAVVLLIKIRRTVPSDLYESARDALFAAFDALAENPIGGLDVSLTICERDNNGDKAKLVVLFGMDSGGVLCHLANENKSTMIQNEHETAGDRGSIVVDGHSWRWSEMVDGVIAAFGLVTASTFAAFDRTIAEIRREFDERAKSAAVAPEVSDEKRRFVDAVTKAVAALAVADGPNTPRYGYQRCEVAFFEAVDAAATYVKATKAAPLCVGAKGELNLMIDGKGLVVVYPGGDDGWRLVTIEDFDDNVFGTLSVVVDGEDRTEMWSMRDALGVMKGYVGWKDPGPQRPEAGEHRKAAAVPS